MLVASFKPVAFSSKFQEIIKYPHNTRPLVPDEYNVFAGKLKIFLLVHGDE